MRRASGRFSVAFSFASCFALAICACSPSPAPRYDVPRLPPVASAPPPVVDEKADDAAIADATRAYLDLIVETSPEDATGLGLHARDADLDDRTPLGEEKQLARKEAMLGDLKKRFARVHASRAARTDLALLTSALAVDVRMRRELRPLERQPDVYAAPLAAIFAMTARDYAPAAERAKNVLARLEKLPDALAVARSNLKSPPRIWTLVGIDAAKGAAAFLDEQRAFLTEALPGEGARIATALKAAKDAYAKLHALLEKEILPRSTPDFAVGRELFEWLLKERAFLDDDADRILELGRSIFERTGAEMDEVARRIDPRAKGWPEVTARLKRRHPKAADLLESYRTEVVRARRFLVEKDVVSFPPGDDCQVLETPPFLRSTLTAAYSLPPPFDPTTRGFFFVTPIDPSLPAAKQEQVLREHGHGDQVDTAVHETYPGHHLQESFARLHPSSIRKATSSPIFNEGWALYAEELMSELGYYTDEERLMQLEWTLVRAARVLIDVGLHTKAMTFEEGVQLLTEKVHLEAPLAASEVKRYTMEPTQPLSYLVGREKIFALRERYRAREGAKFSLKRFHDEILSHGTLAPGLLAAEIFAR